MSEEKTKEANPYDHSDVNSGVELDIKKEAPATPEKVPTPEPQVKEPEKAEPLASPTSKHPKRLVQRAVELGATMAQIAATSTDDLDNWVYETNQQILEEERLSNASRAVQSTPPAPEAKSEPDDEEIINEFEKDGGDPRLTSLMKKLIKENRTIKEATETHAKRIEESEKSRTHGILDDSFELLPDEYKEVFGDGPITEVDDGSRQWRAMVLTAAGIDAKNPPSSPKACAKRIQAAADKLLSKVKKPAPAPKADPYVEAQTKTASNGTPRITEEAWKQAGIPAPTSRVKKEPGGPASAVASAKKWLDDHAAELDDEETTLRGMP